MNEVIGKQPSDFPKKGRLSQTKAMTVYMKYFYFLTVVLTVLLLVLSPMTVSAAETEMDIEVFVDGTELVFDVPPAVVNQRTMVPMRFIFEFLGAEVEWIPEDNGIRATTDTLDLYMQLGNPEMTINGEVLILDAPPYATDGRTLVPLRAVMEAFDAEVLWDQKNTAVHITTPNADYAEALDRTANMTFSPYRLRTSYGSTEYMELTLTNNRLTVTVMTTDARMEKFAICINDGDLLGTTNVKTGSTSRVTVDLSTMSLPNSAMLEVYTKDTDEEYFWSYIYRCLYIEKVNGTYRFSEPKAWDNNRAFYDTWVDPRKYLSSDIPAEIAALSKDICKGVSDDYQKLLKIHDWIAENLYYDMDEYLKPGSAANASAESLLTQKRSVCQGYSDLFTMLVRAQGIPCRQVSGYALGLSAVGYWTEDNIGRTNINHVWNQAYIDHRWITVDATWDSDNVYQNGKYVYGGIDYHLYFDISDLFLAYTHKIISIE